MQTFFSFLQDLALFWLLAYMALAGTYLLVGKFVEWFNTARLADLRIQQKACPEELVRRDFKQSLKSLISISAMLATGFALRAQGLAVPVVELTWFSAILWSLASLLLFDTWFYWAHRALHHPRLYRKIHRWHHRSVTPTVWSNNSDTVLDNLFCQSYWLIAPVLLPAPTIILCLHKLYDQITGMLGHAGYEYAGGRLSASPSPLIGTCFHDLHHSTFNYNFATHFSVWDRLMGTIHPDYDRRVTGLTR